MNGGAAHGTTEGKKRMDDAVTMTGDRARLRAGIDGLGPSMAQIENN
jgi:hypothetical protein